MLKTKALVVNAPLFYDTFPTARWSLWFVTRDGYNQACTPFITKPTAKQMRQRKKVFMRSLKASK